MISKVLKSFVFFCTLFLHTQAFWWSPTTTAAPTVLKQIPLTYFRTYTYQPLTGSPYTFPFFGAGGYGAPQQPPILAGARYDHYATSYPTYNNVNPAPPPEAHKMNKTPSPTTTTTTTAAPTTTTTTTTTTPLPTTTASTTTTTTNTPAYNPGQPIQPLINAGASPHYGDAAEYPTYNRRIYTNNYNPNYYRPHYPYPDYSTHNPPQVMKGGFGGSSRPSHVQFVPCMCPVSVGVTSGLPIGGDQSNSVFLAQSRSTADDDDDSGMELPLETDEELKPKITIEPEIEAVLAKSQVTAEDGKITNKIEEELLYGKPNEDLLASSEQA